MTPKAWQGQETQDCIPNMIRIHYILSLTEINELLKKMAQFTVLTWRQF